MSVKIKTHKGASKRFSKMGNGRIKRKSAFRSHLRASMTTKRVRQLRGTKGLSKGDAGLVAKMLGS